MSSTLSNSSRGSSANGYGADVQTCSISSTVIVLHRHHGDDLLGEDVERVAGDDGCLDPRPRASASRRRRPRPDRRGLREDPPVTARRPRGRRDRCAGCRGEPRRRLDQDDEVDCAHVDPQLRASSSRRARGACPRLSDPRSRALLPGDAAVVRAHELVACELVEPCASRSHSPREFTNTLSSGAPDELEQPRIDGQMGGRPGSPGAGAPGTELTLCGGSQIRHDPSAHVRRERRLRDRALRGASIDDCDLTDAWPVIGRRGSARSPRAGAGSPRARCAAVRGGGERDEPLEREGQVRAALGGGDAWTSSTMTGSTDVSVSRAASEHQVERLGRGDEDVGRVPSRARRSSGECRRCGWRRGHRAPARASAWRRCP